MMLKKATALVVSAVFAVAMLGGCGKDGEVSVDNSQPYYNFTAPEKGEEVAVLTIKDYGTIKIKLFADRAPKAVQNFKGLIEEGYYDGLIFHRVIESFMIQGGDPLGTGTGGESMWGGSFDGGVTEGLYHFQGAVAYANSGSTSTNGSQFYMVTGDEVTEQTWNMLTAYQYTVNLSDEVKEKFYEVGGTPSLDCKPSAYTVFGQIYEGLDVVYAISEVATDSSDKPTSDVVIEKAEIQEYDGEEVQWTLD